MNEVVANKKKRGVDYTKKTPISYYGGKQLMLRYILPNIPKHKTYVEPFVGGGAVFWAKEKSLCEIINDTNKELINFYEQVKNDFVDLEKEIRISLHSRSLHRDAHTVYSNPHMFSKRKRAWAVWVLSSQGFCGQLSDSWGRDKKSDKTVKAIRNKRDNFTEHLAVRLQDVSLECRDAVKIINTTDHEDVFFYVDPPYFNSDMGHYDGYTEEDFEMLLKSLSKVKGKFLLSSYPSDILKKYIKEFGWKTFKVEQRVSASNKSKRKVEVLTANYDISNPLK